jgi:aminopeptidase N
MRTRPAAIVLAAAALVAACGGDALRPTTTTSTAAPVTTAATLPPTTAPTTSTTAPAAPGDPTAPPSTSPPPTDPPPAGVAGAAGLGDPYFPNLGNGGYDVESYDLRLTVEPAAGTLDGRALITATALDDLDTFNLDLLGLEVSEIRVDGRPAGSSRRGAELTVDPGPVLLAGTRFVVEVDYGGTPQRAASAALGDGYGWVHVGGTVYAAAQPDAAHSWFPANDHPSDKATFRFEITTPEPSTAAANGRLIEVIPAGGSRTFVWEMDRPMATNLATIVAGDFVRVERTGPPGIELRDYLPPDLAADPPAPYERIAEMLEYLASVFGPYPFDAYGHAVVPALPGALETQTLTLMGSGLSGPILERVIVHELAHQWYGDSVSPATWQDIWLSEGFATYAEWLWAEHTGGSEAMQAAAGDAHARLAALPHNPPGDPGIGQLFGRTVYDRGALTLHALRVEVGDEAFFTLLEAYSGRYRDGNASTSEFIALAEEIGGRDLGGLFDAWLFEPELPPLPAAG